MRPNSGLAALAREVRFGPIPEVVKLTRSPRRRGRARTGWAKQGVANKTAPPPMVTVERPILNAAQLAEHGDAQSNVLHALLLPLNICEPLLATDSKVRHASVAFSHAMAWLYH